MHVDAIVWLNIPGLPEMLCINEMQRKCHVFSMPELPNIRWLQVPVSSVRLKVAEISQLRVAEIGHHVFLF
jgi:hypothetical protein